MQSFGDEKHILKEQMLSVASFLHKVIQDKGISFAAFEDSSASWGKQNGYIKNEY